ncbi:MAG: crossover junction endodeoxyribonuclease RuvC [Woeseiaceae bacterium]|nr:crossover junction endodeoxyribonuclease RuvC [Woeseiaceae bacterium]
MKNDQRILGIDPGSRATGFGLIDLIGSQVKYISSGVIKSTKGDFTERLKVIHKSVYKLIKEYNPDIMVIESVFVHKNPSSALKLGHARAAALCATFDFDVSVFEYSPREIKKAVVGTGAASKEQVQHMVVSLLNLDGTPAEDAADAIAAALCYSNQRAMYDSLKAMS